MTNLCLGHSKLSLPILLLLVLLAISTQTVLTMWTYTVTWPEGEVTSYTYSRTAHGDCLYDGQRARLTCKRNHGFRSVVNTWLYDPELIVYVSVRCLYPLPSSHHSSPLSMSSSSSAAAAPGCVCTDEHEATTLLSLSASSGGALAPGKARARPCQLEELPPSVLEELDRLEVLDLSHNLLRHLSPSTFASLRALRVLSLAGNPLRHLPEGLVCPLESVEALDLKGMELTTFPAHAFRCDGNDSVTSSARWLDVSGNRVGEMPAASLWYLSLLVYLNASDNLLHVLPAYPLLGAASLTTLDLSRNFLRQLPDRFCEGAPLLRRLSLRGNRFASLTLASFDTCRSLTRLDLTGNLLTSLLAPPASLPSLQHLLLSHNRLTILNSPLVAGGGSVITLDLSHNALRMVGPTALSALTGLVHLDLRENALNESTLDLAAGFVRLTNLQSLRLNRNRFTRLTGDDFQGLSSLQTLDLSQNVVSGVSFSAGTALVRLGRLNLSSNQLASLSPDVLRPLVSLRVLDVSRNLLRRVTTLHVPDTLLLLDASRNSLEEVPELSQQSGSLHLLDLSFNAITRIGESDFRHLSNLGRLVLEHNYLRSIHPSALAPLRRLQRLKLADNRLALNATVWAALFAQLRHLQCLDLSYNRLFDVQVLFQSASLASLQDLDVSYNSIGRISGPLSRLNRTTMRLVHLNLEGCRLREVSADAFSDLIYLRSVNLQGNQLTRVPLFLTHPGIKYRFRDNPVTCDCSMGWLKRDAAQNALGQTVSTHDYDVSACRTLPRGHLRPVRDVGRRDFLCVTGSDVCPAGCTCYCQREGGDPEVVFCAAGFTSVPSRIPPTTRVLSVEGGWLGEVAEVGGGDGAGGGGGGGVGDDDGQLLAVEELYLNNSGVTGISPSAFQRLPNLLLLHLDHNHLESLPPELLARQSNLTSLLLGHNRLLEFPPELLSGGPRDLRALDLSHNSLTTLSADTVRGLDDLGESLEQLRLAGNPWQCGCENARLYDWLRRNLSRVPDYEDMRCGEADGPDRRFHLQAPETAATLDCEEKGGGLPKWVIGVAFIGLPLLLLTVGLAYRFRRVVAAVLYTRFGLQCVKPHSEYVHLGRVFDASVLYDHSDRKCRWWVEQILLPRLTSSSTWRPLRVHVPRNGGVKVTSSAESGDSSSGGGSGSGSGSGSGGSVVDNAVYSVRESAVCIVLVSKHFGAHQHTVTCLGQVLQQAQSRPASLVLVTWGELTKQTLESGIRPFLGRPQHLPITAPFFWERLLYLLPSPHPSSADDAAGHGSRRRPSLISACRFRSLSDVSATSEPPPPPQDSKEDTPPGSDVTQHV